MAFIARATLIRKHEIVTGNLLFTYTSCDIGFVNNNSNKKCISCQQRAFCPKKIVFSGYASSFVV